MESLLNLKKYSTAFIVAYSFIYIISISFFIGFHHPFWTDEKHFYDTILSFSNHLDFNFILHYEEMSTPLPFLLYAGWGKIVGNEISSLRILSHIISIGTFISIYFFFKILFPENRIYSIVAVIAFSLIPYVPGLSFFVYTDLSAILFMLIACISLFKNNSFLFFIFSLAALMCRQYFVFFTFAVFLFCCFQYFNCHKKIYLQMALAAVTATSCLLILCWLWKGFSPDNKLKKLYTNNDFSYHSDALIAYVCCIFLYAAPLYMVLFRSLFKDNKRTLFAFALSFIYWVFPVQASIPATAEGFLFIGFFHKAIFYLLGSGWKTGIVFQFLLSLSLLFILYIAGIIIKSAKDQSKQHVLLAGISTLSFLLIMPLSYLTWEKYILPVIPFIYILLFETPDFQKLINKISSKIEKRTN